MKGKLWILVLLAGAGLCPAMAQETLQGEVTLATDYIFRGYSRSPSDPVLQAGLTYRHRAGFLAGLWGSTLDLDLPEGDPEAPGSEVRLLAGYGGRAGQAWSWSTLAVYYWFPNPGSDVEISYPEVQASARYRDVFSATVAYTPDFLGSDYTGLFVELTGSYPLPGSFYLSAGVGKGFLDPRRLDYWYGQVAAGWSRRRFAAELGYFESDGRPIPLWGRVADGAWLLQFTVRIP